MDVRKAWISASNTSQKYKSWRLGDRPRRLAYASSTHATPISTPTYAIEKTVCATSAATMRYIGGSGEG